MDSKGGLCVKDHCSAQISRAVFPLLSLIFAFALPTRRLGTTSVWPLLTPTCSAVRPCTLSAVLTTSCDASPARSSESSRASTTSLRPPAAA